MNLFGRIFAGIAAVTALMGSAMAQEGAEFYKGKTITYIVATSPGGGYDAYGRLIARFLEKHLDARVVVRNLPGAGHIVGTNFLAAAKPDGLTIGTFNTGLIYAQLLGQEGVQFDLTELSWIGKAASETRTIIVGGKSGYASVEDLQNSSEPVKFGASGIGSASFNETNLINEALGLNLEIIPGFNGNEGELSILRGELVGQLGSKSSLAPFVENNDGAFLLDIGGAASSSGVPQARDLVTDERGVAIVALIESQASLARLTAAPPGVPADRLDALRDAYRASLSDPELIAEAEALGIPIDPAIGDQVAELVTAALNQPDEIVSLVESILNAEKPMIEVEGPLLAVIDGGRFVEFAGPKGKTINSKVSGSRTKITINGQEADRGALLANLDCKIEYDPGDDGNEPTFLNCTGEAAAEASAELVAVTSALLAVDDGGKVIDFNGPNGTVTAKVSGSRTSIVIDGAEAKRGGLAAGMTCKIEYNSADEENEPSVVDCQS